MRTKPTIFRLSLLSFFALLMAFSVAIASAASGETGKTEATPGAQPWMVALVDSSSADAYNGQFCGGSLIHRQWVLTAAHCLEGTRASEVDLVIGRHQLSSDYGERISAAQIINHPQYYDDHDIALIRLSKPATQGAIITPITDVTDHLDIAGIQARVTGWGTLTEEGDDSPDRLHGVNVPIVDDNVCKASYGPGDIGRYELCAGDQDGGADSCYGDSGGPLVVPNANRTGWLQAGVVSWGDGCGMSYGVYTRVSEYEEWIEHHLYGAPSPAPLPEDGGQTPNTDGNWGDDDWESGDWDSAEINDTQLPDSLPFGLAMVEDGNDGYEVYAIYENDSDWAVISSYADGYANLDEYLDAIGEATSGSDIIYVSGTKLFIENIDGGIGATMVQDGNLIYVDASTSLSQLRTIVYAFLNG